MRVRTDGRPEMRVRTEGIRIFILSLCAERMEGCLESLLSFLVVSDTLMEASCQSRRWGKMMSKIMRSLAVAYNFFLSFVA